MRLAGGVTVAVIATIIGLSAAWWFALAGLLFNGGWTTAYYWDPTESPIGVAFGVMALVVWLLLLVAAVAILRRDSSGTRMVSPVLLWSVAGVSTAAVIVVCVMVFNAPQPPSEYPLPPWNRA